MESDTVWIRTDGQRINGNMALEQQARIDIQVCEGRTSQAAAMAPAAVNGFDSYNRSYSLARAANGCMYEKGYALVQRDKKEEQIEAFAVTNAERQKLKKNQAN
jgi:hypothetical protein